MNKKTLAELRAHALVGWIIFAAGALIAFPLIWFSGFKAPPVYAVGMISAGLVAASFWSYSRETRDCERRLIEEGLAKKQAYRAGFDPRNWTVDNWADYFSTVVPLYVVAWALQAWFS